MDFTKALTITAVIFLTGVLTANAASVTILKHQEETILLINEDSENRKNNEQNFLELRLAGSGNIRWKTSDGFSRLEFSAGSEPENIYLHRGLIGSIPEKLIITPSEAAFDLYSARLIRPSVSDEPLPADIGHIIFSDFDEARTPDWEIYRWNLLPKVLIFDTADYKIQASFFKRLAFYVEKPGYTGRLLTNEQMEGKHGWNAHDYRPDDLAAFFSSADNENFKLNEEEEILKKLLLTEKIILPEQAGGYSGGSGAVLSVSRASPPEWRYRFLTHECLHGIFFSDDSYRSGCQSVFRNLDPDETEFWKHLLDYRGYDVENFYLLSNEFMAYCLQQPIEEVNDYFKGFLYQRMTAARPFETAFVEQFDRDHPDSFIKAVKALEEVLKRSTGRSAGHLANLFPSDIPSSFYDLFPLK